MGVSENLFEDVRNYLDITWSQTEDEKRKLEGMIARGMVALTGKIGTCDFEQQTQEKTLLLNYVMYDRAGSLSEFWRSYMGDIIALRLKRKVEKYAEENSDV